MKALKKKFPYFNFYTWLTRAFPIKRPNPVESGVPGIELCITYFAFILGVPLKEDVKLCGKVIPLIPGLFRSVNGDGV